MRYSQIRAFHHVALHGGFSRAAEALNQTQPALSDQVRRLEQAHDTLLFHRDRRQVRLTEAGAELFRLTQRFFEMEGSIADHLDRSRAAVAGRLRIVADSALHVTGALRRFRDAHPRVLVSISTGNTETVLATLRDYAAELGIVGNLAPAQDLLAWPLGRSPVIAIAARGLFAPGTSLRMADLADWPLVIRESGSRTRQCIEDAARRCRIRLRPVVEVDGREAMREVVATGAGLGFLSEAEFGRDARLDKLPISDLEAEMTETLVCLSARAEVPVIRAFLRSLSDGTAEGG